MPKKRVTWSAVVVALVGVSCTHASSTKPSAAGECGEPIDGLGPLIEPGRTLVLGEVHGAREVAQFAGDAVCRAAQLGPTVLALEMPAHAEFGAFLESDGGAAAREVLLAAPFWTALYQDGRENVAALELLDRVRRLKQAGLPVSLLLFDAQPAQPAERDRLMADKVIARHAEAPGATIIVVTGNLHARKVVGSPWKPDDGYGWLASRLTWPVTSLNARHADGTAWVCSSPKPEECGPKPLAGDDVKATRGVQLTPSADLAYDGVFDVVTFTAAPPAAFPERAIGLDAQLAALLRGPELTAARARRAGATGRYEECSRLFGELPEPSSDDLYNQACCLSQANRVDDAFEVLARSVKKGFSDFKALQEDTDLANLHRDPRWAALKK